MAIMNIKVHHLNIHSKRKGILKMTEQLQGWGAWDRVWKYIPTQINSVYWRGRDLVKNITNMRRSAEYGQRDRGFRPALHGFIRGRNQLRKSRGKFK